MPAIALLAPEVWEALKLANIRGATDEDLARQFEVSREAIRSRRMRDKSWSAAMNPIQSKAIATGIATEAQNQAKTGQIVRETLARSMADIHAGTALQLAHASAKVLAAFAEKPAPILDWQDASTAYKVQRLATGQDKEGAEVKVNVAMFTDGMSSVMREDAADWGEAETVQIDPEP